MVIALIEMEGSEMSYEEKTAIALAILFLVAFRVFFYEFGVYKIELSSDTEFS